MPTISWTYLWYIEHTCYIPVIYWISLWCSSIPVTPWKYLWYLEHTWYIINIHVISWTYKWYPEHTCYILDIPMISYTYMWYLEHTCEILNIPEISCCWGCFHHSLQWTLGAVWDIYTSPFFRHHFLRRWRSIERSL